MRDAAFYNAFKVHYARILTDVSTAPTEIGTLPTSMELNRLSPLPELPAPTVRTSGCLGMLQLKQIPDLAGSEV